MRWSFFFEIQLLTSWQELPSVPHNFATNTRETNPGRPTVFFCSPPETETFKNPSYTFILELFLLFQADLQQTYILEVCLCIQHCNKQSIYGWSEVFNYYWSHPSPQWWKRSEIHHHSKWIENNLLQYSVVSVIVWVGYFFALLYFMM